MKLINAGLSTIDQGKPNLIIKSSTVTLPVRVSANTEESPAASEAPIAPKNSVSAKYSPLKPILNDSEVANCGYKATPVNVPPSSSTDKCAALIPKKKSSDKSNPPVKSISVNDGSNKKFKYCPANPNWAPKA